MEAHARLAHEYGGDLPPGLSGLSEASAAALVDAIQAARRHQTAALQAATEAGLGFIPKVLRGPVTRVLFR